MSSPSFLAISDVHIGLNLYNQPDLGADLCRLFTEACQLAASLAVDYLVIVGDLYDSNKPTPDLISFVRDQVEVARMEGVRVVGIAGDHDKPVQTDSWAKVSGVGLLDSVPQFAGCDYSDTPAVITDYLRTAPHLHSTEWIFLHGQAPSLWHFCDARKKLDLGAVPLFELYPNLRGVILGDIHKPLEGTIQGNGKKAYIGYCGSLGITSSTDIGNQIGLLHFDGTTLKRVPFDLGRDFVRIDLTTNANTGMEIGYYIEKYGKHRGRRPVFLIEYTFATKHRLSDTRPLYQLGIVRELQITDKTKQVQHQAVSIRSDLNNSERISAVLNGLVPDEEVRSLVSATLHSEDPKLVLDAFRRKYIG